MLAWAQRGEDRHLVAAHDAARLRFCLRSATVRGHDHIVITRDAHSLARHAAAEHFERVTQGLGVTKRLIASPTAARRGRLVQLLAICDALASGATTREIAYGLVYRHDRPLGGAAWKGSDQRRHSLRLIAAARRLSTSGYLELLLHR